MLTIDAVLLGGGQGVRFSSSLNASIPKQFSRISGLPVFLYALKALKSLDCIRRFFFVVPPEHLELAEELIQLHCSVLDPREIRVIAGGSRRLDSSRLALDAIECVSTPPTRVLIHDACRPILPSLLLARVQTALLDRSYGAWVPVVPARDTLKQIRNDQVVETLNRTEIYHVQTPQVFEFSVIKSLIDKAKSLEGHEFTDDASVCEYYGIPVGVFEGDVRNIKLTYGFEIETLRSLLGSEDSEEVRKCEPASDMTFTD
ncbi:MAG: 2-C-methyl-D-erythritol 4-phosphate cytidylyltransferase [Deltaproteobacteria bacterium]|nr:2-C-methyl-D-erythritol 4-phosphate cytidylyltransferase [Deltaproteobacteria bacterium]